MDLFTHAQNLLPDVNIIEFFFVKTLNNLICFEVKTKKKDVHKSIHALWFKITNDKFWERFKKTIFKML
jgi:hypothetical protein